MHYGTKLWLWMDLCIVLFLAYWGLLIIEPSWIRTIPVGDKEIKYEYYLFDNRYCQYRSGGHCTSNGFNKHNAICAFAIHFLDNEPMNDLSGSVLKELIHLDPFIENRTHDKGDLSNINIDTICKYRYELFRPFFIK